MAIVQNTLIGRASGRVGNAVFSQWKDKNILKQKPEIVANPRSAQQQSNRARFVALMQLGLLLRPVLQIGFKEYSHKMSWLNKFMSTNTGSNLFEWTGTPESGSWTRNNENLVISEGSLYPSLPTSAAFTNASTFQIEFSAIAVGNQTFSDSFIGIAMSESQTVVISRLEGITRSDGVAQFIFPTPLADGEDAVFSYYFLSPDGLIVSNSVTIGATYETP